jgi:hypothetical protein
VTVEASHLRVWFAAPAAAATFDATTLEAGEQQAWNALRTDRRRRDWAVSRVLSGSVTVPDSACRSLSHSHAHAALAGGPAGGAVGVDLEWMATRDFAGMAQIGFSPAEAAYIAMIGEPARRRAVFYELWTLKEACTKALPAAAGRPAAMPLRERGRAWRDTPNRPVVARDCVCAACRRATLARLGLRSRRRTGAHDRHVRMAGSAACQLPVRHRFASRADAQPATR